MTRGEAMRAARERAGLSVRALAKRADIAFMTVYRLEKENHNGSITTIELLADALGISIDEYTGHEVVSHD